MDDVSLVDPATEFAGQVAIVTGGVGGIGSAIARRLAAGGARVIAADIAPDTLQRAADIVSATTNPKVAARIEGAVLDVADPMATQEFVRESERRFGRIDILINNAGRGGRSAPLWETTLESWDRHVAVGLTGVFLMCRAVIPVMLRTNYGRIVNISSMAGKEGNVDSSPYVAAKAGQLGLTKTIGKELAHTGILCNAITPGVVRSPLNAKVSEELHHRLLAKIPMGRPGEPTELAELVAFLAGRRASFSTGAVYDFSGGRATY